MSVIVPLRCVAPLFLLIHVSYRPIWHHGCLSREPGDRHHGDGACPGQVTAAGCEALMVEQRVIGVHEFSDGVLNGSLAYAMSCLGSFLGLRCLTRARAHTGFARANWLILAAVAIGAAGNWTMHFIAMLGFSLPGQRILYNVPLTIESMLIAIVVVGIGLFIVGYGNGGRVRLVTAGVIAGLGVACMHYLGEAAMVMPDTVHYAIPLVIVSVLIAVLSSTPVLWAGTRVRGIGSTIVASLIMGVAITGTHYTAMSAMEMTPGSMPSMSGATAGSLLFPLVLGISLVTFVLAVTISLSPTAEEIRADATLKRRIEAGSRGGSHRAAPSRPPVLAPPRALGDPSPALAVPFPAPVPPGPATRPQGSLAPKRTGSGTGTPAHARRRTLPLRPLLRRRRQSSLPQRRPEK